MKIKITKPDGSVIEAEGTPKECHRLAGLERNATREGRTPEEQAAWVRALTGPYHEPGAL